jgi:hypothetical protein
MTKEALKLALDALEEAADAIDSWGSYASEYFQVKHDLENDISKAKSAITDIKEALAQPEHCSDCGQKLGDANHIHTCSPQRTWVGLTDEEINSVRYKRDWTAPWTDTTFARAIEAKLKEKNT